MVRNKPAAVGLLCSAGVTSVGAVGESGVLFIGGIAAGSAFLALSTSRTKSNAESTQEF